VWVNGQLTLTHCGSRSSVKHLSFSVMVHNLKIKVFLNDYTAWDFSQWVRCFNVHLTSMKLGKYSARWGYMKLKLIAMFFVSMLEKLSFLIFVQADFNQMREKYFKTLQVWGRLDKLQENLAFAPWHEIKTGDHALKLHWKTWIIMELKDT
jgi:hypothetical protein